MIFISTISATSEQTGYHQDLFCPSAMVKIYATFARTGGDTGSTKGLQGIHSELLSPESPTPADVGDFWYDNDDSALFIYYDSNQDVINGLRLVLPNHFGTRRYWRGNQGVQGLQGNQDVDGVQGLQGNQGHLQGQATGTQGTQGLRPAGLKVVKVFKVFKELKALVTQGYRFTIDGQNAGHTGSSRTCWNLSRWSKWR